jgi:hypothetical protein
MSINIEITTEVMDTISFILVTPEFLRTETLSSVRNFLTNITDYLSDKIWPYFGLIYLLTVSIFGGPMVFFDITPFSLLESHRVVENIIGILLLLVFFVGVTLGVTHLTLIITKSLFIRQAMFVMGAILFFLARAISVAHSWGQPGG